jgi:hypothetical protein
LDASAAILIGTASVAAMRSGARIARRFGQQLAEQHRDHQDAADAEHEPSTCAYGASVRDRLELLLDGQPRLSSPK